ncbi:hypothetical protein ACLB2K_031475 [Fragaria x ananassa]
MEHIDSYFVVFSINAPKLENFDLLDHFQLPSKYNFENGKSLVKVKLELLDYDDYGADDGIADCATALFTHISNVEDLSLSLRGLNYNKWRHREYELRWEFFNPQERPACLMSHLKTISIEGFKGQRDEMEVAEYLLKNG